MKIKLLERFRKWRLSLPKLTDLVDSRHLRLIILGAFLATFIAVFLVVFTSMNRKRLAEEELRQKQEAEKGSSLQLTAPGFDDFVFPETIHLKSNQIFLTREPRSFWSDEEIQTYWVDLETIDLDSFTRQNHNIIESKLDEVP